MARLDDMLEDHRHAYRADTPRSATPEPLTFEPMARAAMRVVERRTPLSPGLLGVRPIERSGMKVYVAWWDPDYGYAAARILGVFATREAAEQRLRDEGAVYDAGVIEFTVDEPSDEALT